MSLQIVVGAGPVGTATARLLAERGDQVRVITRSGSGPEGVERIAADATDADVLARYAEGASTIYSCAGRRTTAGRPTGLRSERRWSRRPK